MKTRFIIWTLLSFLAFAGCQSLEDTYKEYAGDGVIRYVGQCDNVTVRPGWKRLIVNWTNSIDPIIDKIKVRWIKDGIRDSVLLPPDYTDYSIPDLETGSYEVTVCGVDYEGRESYSIPLYVRPYTSEHETIRAFTRLVASHYLLRNRLVFYFSPWVDNIKSATISYYTSRGDLKTLELTSDLVSGMYYLVPEEIDVDKPITLYRSGWVEGCEDLIDFDPYEFSKYRLYSTEFKQVIHEKYGIEEITDEVANRFEEIELDFSINTFEDILNFPNLKKLILGRNRYLKAEYLPVSISSYASACVVNEVEASLFAMDVSNEVLGLTVERYNQHYFPDVTLPYMIEMGNPEAPDIAYMNTTGWGITCTPKDGDNYNSHVENLIDGNLSNYWQPEYMTSARTHEIVVDMKETKTIKGVTIAQQDFNPLNEKDREAVLPVLVQIKVSTNNITWEIATHMEECSLGNTAGETTILYFPTSIDARYIKFIVNDQLYGQNFSVTLAEISVF